MVKTMLSHRDLQHVWHMSAINRLLVMVFFGMAILLISGTGHAEEASKEQIKGLDEQVQEIKSDVLTIAAELNHLEERLLYPSNTQVAVFVSLQADDEFLLDSVEIRLNGEPVAHHIYSYKELDALRRGGVQRVYTGNLRTGKHEVQVTMLARTKGGSDLTRTESFQIEKSVKPKAVEITLSGPGLADEAIELKEL